MAKILEIGTIGSDIEVKTLGNGTRKATFSFATEEGYKKGDDFIKETSWWQVDVWGKQVDTAEKHFFKGMELFIEGQAKIREYETKEGEKRKIGLITMERFKFTRGSKRKDVGVNDGVSDGVKTDKPSQAGKGYHEDDKGDDLPF